ncbi:MAG: helix-turn-helix transcriptional regulator [Chloroflexota bacterium]
MSDKGYVTFDESLARDLEDPEFRREWDRLRLANAVSLEIVKYRAKHHLSQTALAKRLGMKQSAIARLEAAEHNPTFETLCRLSSVLGVEFLVDIAPAGRRRRWVNKLAERSGETIDVEGSQILIATH